MFIDRGVEQIWYIYTMEYYLAIKNEIISFPTTWMKLEGIMLNSDRKRQIPYDM